MQRRAASEVQKCLSMCAVGIEVTMIVLVLAPEQHSNIAGKFPPTDQDRSTTDG